jgi:hypothetical protein
MSSALARDRAAARPAGCRQPRLSNRAASSSGPMDWGGRGAGAGPPSGPGPYTGRPSSCRTDRSSLARRFSLLSRPPSCRSLHIVCGGFLGRKGGLEGGRARRVAGPGDTQPRCATAPQQQHLRRRAGSPLAPGAHHAALLQQQACSRSTLRSKYSTSSSARRVSRMRSSGSAPPPPGRASAAQRRATRVGRLQQEDSGTHVIPACRSLQGDSHRGVGAEQFCTAGCQPPRLPHAWCQGDGGPGRQPQRSQNIFTSSSGRARQAQRRQPCGQLCCVRPTLTALLRT